MPLERGNRGAVRERTLAISSPNASSSSARRSACIRPRSTNGTVGRLRRLFGSHRPTVPAIGAIRRGFLTETTDPVVRWVDGVPSERQNAEPGISRRTASEAMGEPIPHTSRGAPYARRPVDGVRTSRVAAHRSPARSTLAVRRRPQPLPHARDRRGRRARRLPLRHDPDLRARAAGRRRRAPRARRRCGLRADRRDHRRRRRACGSVWRGDDGSVLLPFDPDESILRTYVSEDYHAVARGAGSAGPPAFARSRVLPPAPAHAAPAPDRDAARAQPRPQARDASRVAGRAVPPRPPAGSPRARRRGRRGRRCRGSRRGPAAAPRQSCSRTTSRRTSATAAST